MRSLLWTKFTSWLYSTIDFNFSVWLKGWPPNNNNDVLGDFYSKRLDVALQESKFATLFATHGEYCDTMKEEILNALFVPPEEIRTNPDK